MNKRLRTVVLAILLIAASVFSGTFGLLAENPEGLSAITASATAAGVKITKQPVSVTWQVASLPP